MVLPVGREVLEAGVLLGSEVLHGSFESRVVAGHDVLLGLQGTLPLLPLPPSAAHLGAPLAQGLLYYCSPSPRCHAMHRCSSLSCIHDKQIVMIVFVMMVVVVVMMMMTLPYEHLADLRYLTDNVQHALKALMHGQSRQTGSGGGGGGGGGAGHGNCPSL